MKNLMQHFFIKNPLTLFAKVSLVFLTFAAVEGARGATAYDFDGDGKADIAVFRRSDGFWHVLKSTGGIFSVKWGLANDTPVAGDWDGDGRTDVAVHRHADWENGFYDNFYYIRKSSDSNLRAVQWGQTTGFVADMPTPPANYDGDNKIDLATYYFSDAFGESSFFRVFKSLTETEIIQWWGRSGYDKPLPADYDGDGLADYAVSRRDLSTSNAANYWFILQSSNGAVRVEQFGRRDDKYVPADYDGDGKADIAVWRPSDGVWYRINSRNNSFSAIQFGTNGDKPVPADYDGDGQTDLAVFRPSIGAWYLQRSTAGLAAHQFGLSDDVPIPNVFINFFS